MGWTIDGRVPVEPHATAELFSTLGRALYVASQFEQKCFFVLQIVTVSKSCEERSTNGRAFDELFAPVNGGSTLLGATLRGLRDTPQLEHELSLLHDGRLARNYIAHSAAAKIGRLGGIKAKDIQTAVADLREQVEILAKADAVISRIIYWIEEKGEPAPDWLEQHYSTRLLEWVFDGNPERLAEDRLAWQKAILSGARE